jgi:hypothetical protein
MALFTVDTRFLVFMDATAAEPTQELLGRELLAPVFDNLNTYAATMHFNGQSTVSVDGDRATGESYCLAHHLLVGEDGQRTMMIASIRYLDEFVKQDGQWLFAERPPELAKLVDNQTIRILDLVFLSKDTSGNVAVIEVDEVGGLIGPEDIGFVGDELDPGSAAAVLLVENLWAASLASALDRSGGFLLEGARIPKDLVDAAVAGLPAA